jgi:DNA-binding beta-propeller fold protein YncE
MLKNSKTILFKQCVLLMTLILLILPLQASQKSSSMLFSKNKMLIYSANFDAGSVSMIDKQSGKLLHEKTIGRDIRRLALTADNKLLLASDYLGDKLVLLDANDLSIINEVTTEARPFGIVFDNKNQQFYAVSFEKHKLMVINRDGEITNQLDVAETPRGLALTDDGRLLITHALTAELSIYDVTGATPILSKVLQLINTEENKVLSVPQGKPRLLDNIAISPDGSQAWLPHILWSFGHDFQFQSTVFPAISIIDLTKGQETELLQQRKLLFKQINIIESGNNQRIVANPHDAAFTDDGKKVIISTSGSEDLIIFDLSRQSKSNKKRHRRKKFQGGVKATQIFRNVPGDNPKAVLISGQDLYVQKAMSLDISKFDIGKPGPFSKVKLKIPEFAALVSQDPVAPQMRLGKTLFNSANTAKGGDYPVAGDFWMSCNSCHLDGFNFTNRYLMQDGKEAKDRFENAVTGHVDVIKMVVGDPVGAYVDIIQKTQGGLGGDPREGKAALIDPLNVPVEVAKQMSAIHEYVLARENLPYGGTWLRLDDEKRYTHPEQWLNSAECQDCHTTIYDQWADSNHGMNMDHPYYRFQENFAAQQEGEEFRALCRGCHAPQGIINNDKGPLTEYGDMWEKKGKSLMDAMNHGQAVSERGTGCVFCHRVSKAENSGGNTDMTINLKDRDAYVFEDSRNSFMKWLEKKQIDAFLQPHKDSYSNPDLYQSSLYCATCHNEFTTGAGASVNDNFGEWVKSPFNNPKDPSKHKTCIDCHMTQDVTNFDNKVAGQSTNNGPIKENMRSHHFVGGNYYFTGMRNPEHKKLSIDILKTALTLEGEKQGDNFTAKVTNVNSGHDMPGGARRQVWIELIVTDAIGSNVFESGVMKNGVIPKDARRFIKIGVDKEGKSVGLAFWRYSKIGQDTRIKSGETRNESFQLPTDLNYPIVVSTRVLYQAFAKGLSDKVRNAFPDEKIPEPEVIELEKLVINYSK